MYGMSIKSSAVLFMSFGIVLYPLIKAQDVVSSLANRTYACPGELVTYTCTVENGQALIWILPPYVPLNNQITFLPNDSFPGSCRFEGDIPVLLTRFHVNDSIPGVATFTSQLIFENSNGVASTTVTCSNGITNTSVEYMRANASRITPPKGLATTVDTFGTEWNKNVFVSIEWQQCDGSFDFSGYFVNVTDLTNSEVEACLQLNTNLVQMALKPGDYIVTVSTVDRCGLFSEGTSVTLSLNSNTSGGQNNSVSGVALASIILTLIVVTVLIAAVIVIGVVKYKTKCGMTLSPSEAVDSHTTFQALMETDERHSKMITELSRETSLIRRKLEALQLQMHKYTTMPPSPSPLSERHGSNVAIVEIQNNSDYPIQCATQPLTTGKWKDELPQSMENQSHAEGKIQADGSSSSIKGECILKIKAVGLPHEVTFDISFDEGLECATFRQNGIINGLLISTKHEPQDNNLYCFITIDNDESENTP